MLQALCCLAPHLRDVRTAACVGPRAWPLLMQSNLVAVRQYVELFLGPGERKQRISYHSEMRALPHFALSQECTLHWSLPQAASWGRMAGGGTH